MKLFLLSTVLVAAGASWLGLATPESEASAPSATECRATVECTPQGTCILTCYGEDGEVRCRREIPCPVECGEESSCSR